MVESAWEKNLGQLRYQLDTKKNKILKKVKFSGPYLNLYKK